MPVASDFTAQRTLARSVTAHGPGVHSGILATARLEPAEASTGIRFVRTDLAGAPEIRVTPGALASGVRCTGLMQGGVRVQTVEHLLAACLALGIDNLRVMLDTEELPILDGSALPWVQLLQDAGGQTLESSRTVIRLTTPVSWSDDVATLVALPAPHLRLTVVFLTDHPVADRQVVDLVVTPETFINTLAPARTFCFREEVEALRAAGLARGGSLENALVVDQSGYLTPLRVPSELAAHKALDLLGDLATLGVGLAAHVVAIRSGHAVNQQLVRRIWAEAVRNQDVFEPTSSTL